MLQLLLGTDWVANRNAILQMVADDVCNSRGNRILVVPELISHDMERRLCTVAGDTASRFAEVVSFSRLGRRVSEYTGLVTEPSLDGGGRVVAMASVARQLRGSLKAYASLQTKPEFLTGLLDAIDEFKRCCISPADLMLASRKTEGGFAQKLEELSLLLEGYDAVTSRGKRDPRDQMALLLERLKDCAFGEEHVFYVDGFPDFTRQHMEILGHLISTSSKVVVSLNCDRSGSDAPAFAKAGETAKMLLTVAKRFGIEAQVVHIGAEETPLKPLNSALLQGRLPAGLENSVFAYHGGTIFDEVSAAANAVEELVAGGARYRDIAVVCGDAEKYRRVLTRVFSRYGIPLYLSGTESILDRSLIHTVLAALEAALCGFAQKDVFRYLRSALSPLSLSQCDRLENYGILWSITGSKWAQPFENHPDGLNMEWTPDSRARLAELNTIRELVMAPLLKMRDSFRQAEKLAAYVKALYTFMEDINIGERLESLAEQFDRSGDNRSAQIVHQLWDILIPALEQMYDVLGETAWDSDTFARLLRLLLSQYDVGTIPPVLDAVTAGPASAMRCQESRHLIVLGMQEGSMPGYGSSGGILTDKERIRLRNMGIPLTGGAMDGLSIEFSEIYGVFCGARESVRVFCPDGQPSFLFRRLSEVSGGEKNVSYLPLADAAEMASYLISQDMESEADKLGLGEAYRHIRQKKDYCYGNISKENVQDLYGNMLNLSASQVDKLAECKMRYFLQYGIRARERKPITVDPAEYGTYVHDVLEQTAREVMEKGGFANCVEDEVLEIAMRHSNNYISTHFSGLDSQRTAYLLERNSQELKMVVRELWDELRHSKFLPWDFEVYFGDGGVMPPITVQGAEMEAKLRGYVDRVDVWCEDGQNYFRVVDYKTGRKSFDYCDVFNGIGLQMLLYLFALEQGGEAILGEHPVPAGVQYFPARAPIVGADNAVSDEAATAMRLKEWKRKGLLLNDKEVLAAMEPDGAVHRLDCSNKKDGGISGAVADRQQFQMLKCYVFNLLSQMVDTISAGDITPNPYTRGSYHNACAFCPYGEVCHPEDVPGRRDYQAMNADRFWEEIEKEMKHRG